MRKTLSLLLCAAVMLIGCVSVSAAPGKNNTTRDTAAEFYIQRFGVQLDEKGNVLSQDTSYFTNCVYKSRLTPGKRETDYSLVYDEGSVSSDDVIKEVTSKPSDAEVFSKVKAAYENNGYILSSSGKVVSWDKFNTDNYKIRWYVLKYEPGYSHYSGIWHIDGVITEIETDKPIEIPSEGDPGYVPPDELEPDEPSKLPQYTSDYAYIYGYDDTTMGADGHLLRSEVSAMVHRLVKQNNKLGGFVYNEAAAPAFADIAGEWFRSGIEFMNYKGAFAADENVYPYAVVTRGETFKIICLGLDYTKDTSLSFDDYANLLYNAGFITGDENGNLNIANAITRAEFCTVYNKIIGRDAEGLKTADGTEITAESYGFKDLSETDWYYETMLKATSAYDDDGFVDIEKRNHRNTLDDFQ